MKMTKCLSFLPALALTVFLAGCAATAENAEALPPPQAVEPAAPDPSGELSSGERGSFALDLNDPDSHVPGVSRDGGAVTLSGSGSYRVTGQLAGSLTVDTDGPLELILAGAEITGENCLEIRSRAPVTIILAAGTVNTLSDGAPEPDEQADAVIFSKAPLTIGGEGSLSVNGRGNNGIQGRDSVAITGGTIAVTASNDGVKAAGDLSVTGGELYIYAAGDGLSAKNARVIPGRVYLSGGRTVIQAGDRGIDGESSVELTGGSAEIQAQGDGLHADSIGIYGGTLSVDVQGDGLQAVSLLYIEDGSLEIRTGGGGGEAASHPGESFGPWGQSQSTEESVSAKGLKSDGDITIAGGSINLDTADDAIHCAAVCTIGGGEISLVSSDDAVHADDMLVINDGVLRIDDCFEGLEAFAVEVRGGDVTIRAVNDGINANGMEMMFARNSTQESEFTSASGAETTYFLMAGGKVDLVVTGNMSNQGDGVDSNGAVYITGGELIVSTYGSFMENGLDTGWGGPTVTGGMVMAGGSSTMTESFSSYSTQCCAVIPTSYMPDGTEVTITDEDGNGIWSVVMADAFSCLQISHPDLQEGHVYTLAYGSESTELDFTATTNISRSGGFGGPGRPF